MSILKRLACTALLAVLAAPVPCMAQDIFVRPNSGGSAPTVDYGVRAKPAAPPATTTPTPAAPAPVQPQQPRPQPVPQQPVAQQPRQPAPVQPTTPQQPAMSIPPMGNDVQVQSLPNNASIFKLAEDPPPGPGQGNGTFTIGFKGGALGRQDKSNLLYGLGYSESEIQGNCFFKYATMLTYNGGQAAYLNTGTAQSFRYNFTPPLEKINVFPIVACRKLRAPISGITVEKGGYFENTLPSVECPVSNSAAGAVSFSYLGDGRAACQ